MKAYKITKTGTIHLKKETSLMYRVFKQDGLVYAENGNTVTFFRDGRKVDLMVIVFIG